MDGDFSQSSGFMVVEVEVSSPPNSLNYIRNKLRGRKLTRNEIREIIKDVVSGELSEVEITSFVTSLHHFALDIDEATSLSWLWLRRAEPSSSTRR